ncbi:MAG TPA: hypothetical protein VHN15_04615 [Thermoanaerobaculia bacterium]|nr:hypothetical protein [Thermoanaerobaculia bacterium]
MVKLRLAFAVALLLGVSFGATADPRYHPQCWEDYVACMETNPFPGDCNCFYQMCIGGICP